MNITINKVGKWNYMARAIPDARETQLTWSGSSMSIPRRCAIFDIAFSKILLDPDLTPLWSSSTGAGTVHPPEFE